ncbi:nucleotidyltransferase domain-containing protein [Tepidibacillus sp. LV47]|uniref:nucleotidyltransferase domain-containing protein n=1 Tax=Tepidibacillus sp. LV47 TaxID=3398228 RepID=UPI003AAC78EB
MSLASQLGVSEDLLNQIINVISKYEHIEKVVVFGSRAKGNGKKTSDIDLCVFGERLLQNDVNLLIDELKELNTPLDFDVVHFQSLSKEKLKENIMREGVKIYDKRKAS